MSRILKDIVIIASHNLGKIKEISAILSSYNIASQSAGQLNLDEPEENGEDYLANALIKARACVRATRRICLADDSGIEVLALANKPGVDTAPFTKSLGGREKVFKLWQENEDIKKNPKAAFLCTQVLMWPDEYYEYENARVDGKLVFPPRGNLGHGYDPIFVPENMSSTVAELSFEDKNYYSHRARALRALIKKVLPA
jgi:XTP/dITP diphosphohydrolase